MLAKTKNRIFWVVYKNKKLFFPQPHTHFSLLHTHMQASAVKTARTNFIVKSKYKQYKQWTALKHLKMSPCYKLAKLTKGRFTWMENVGGDTPPYISLCLPCCSPFFFSGFFWLPAGRRINGSISSCVMSLLVCLLGIKAAICKLVWWVFAGGFTDMAMTDTRSWTKISARLVSNTHYLCFEHIDTVVQLDSRSSHTSTFLKKRRNQLKSIIYSVDKHAIKMQLFWMCINTLFEQK